MSEATPSAEIIEQFFEWLYEKKNLELCGCGYAGTHYPFSGEDKALWLEFLNTRPIADRHIDDSAEEEGDD